jgi:quaternary ammonium compound-resistance protein SugE
MAWIILVLAALLEPVWAIALSRSGGLTRLWPSALGVSAAAASFLLLTFSLRTLPVGTAYAVWVGIGAAGVVIAGISTGGDNASPLRLCLLALIMIGVIGLKVIE